MTLIKKPETITVSVSETGEVQVAVAGVAGAGCTALTAALLAALGETVSEQKTAEYSHAHVAAGTHQTLGR